ncbi:MAG: phosphatase PAP2 family protein [Bryobacteraceae bacterium]|nr:phosphatase PAP2 family protein [Bryobacteraceae bacterium]
MAHFRLSERICLAYFAYTAAVAALRPLPMPVRLEVWAADAGVFLILWLLSRPATAQRPPAAVLRDWFPLALILLAYRQMGWMALPHENRNFENFWIGLDRLLLHKMGLKSGIEFFGPLLPNLLELSYLLVYVMPVAAVAVLYGFGARQRLDAAYRIVLSATLASYALYPFFPSEPPRSVFPADDLPLMSALRAFNLRILGAYGIHMSVFPSGHAAAAFSCAFAVRRLLPERPAVGLAFLVLAVLIAVATVYGRYHFAVDTAAGLLMALGADWLHAGSARAAVRSRR